METEKEALTYLLEEFVDRFTASAEGCADPQKTIAAVEILNRSIGLKITWVREPYKIWPRIEG